MVSVSLALRLVGSSHDGVDVDVSVKACSRQHRGVPGTPLDVKAPLSGGGQLVQHLRIQAGHLISSDLTTVLFSTLVVLHL